MPSMEPQKNHPIGRKVVKRLLRSENSGLSSVVVAFEILRIVQAMKRKGNQESASYVPLCKRLLGPSEERNPM